jgi:hypothetical protein
MRSHTRAMATASAHAVMVARKVAGIYEQVARRDLLIAAECRKSRLPSFDGDRFGNFGDALPEPHDEGDKVFVSLNAEGARAQAHDRGSAGLQVAGVGGGWSDYSIIARAPSYDLGVQIARARN